MKVTFDPEKRAATLRERGLDFVDAADVFEGETYSSLDTRSDYGEQRVQTIGFLNERMTMVVWTPRGEARHIISMRKCNDREQKKYGPQFSR